MTIENHYDVSFVAALALREKQIQQNYRPIIAVHKWFARRPGTLFRALVLSEFGNAPRECSKIVANNGFKAELLVIPRKQPTSFRVRKLKANAIICSPVGCTRPASLASH
jgi:Protein of unknown function (DUF1156)